MRENKYRVWCIDQQEYEKEETYLTPDGRLFRKYVLDGKWRDDTKLHIVEFFTGLKDKNGVEVYDGDIYYNPESKLRGKLFYQESPVGGYELWCEENQENGEPYNRCRFGDLDLTGFEVIGNIHE